MTVNQLIEICGAKYFVSRTFMIHSMSFLITKLPVNERARVNEPATLVIPSSWLLKAMDRQYRGPPPLA